MRYVGTRESFMRGVRESLCSLYVEKGIVPMFVSTARVTKGLLTCAFPVNVCA